MFFWKKKWGKDTEIIECPIYGRLCTSVVHVFKGWQLLFSVYREWKQISERRSIFLIIPNHLLTIIVKVLLCCHWGPCWHLRPMLPYVAIWMSMACDIAMIHDGVPSPCCGWGPCWCMCSVLPPCWILWSLLMSQAMWIAVVHVVSCLMDYA